MKVRVLTGRYEWSHGHKPKGYGYWAFNIGEETVWIQGMYSEAKKKAIREAKVRKLYQVEVLP